MTTRRTLTAVAAVLAAALLLPAAASAKAFSVSRDVGVYRAPNTASGIGVVKSGGQVNVQCWTRGQAVGGYPIWDRIDYRGGSAYVHDRYVEMPGAGSPAAAGIPECAGQGGLVNWRKLADGILAKDYRTFMNIKDSPPTDGLDWTSDGCSGPAVIREAYRRIFDQPCQLHDFGYRNYGQGRRLGRNDAMRAHIDLRFLAEMKRLCGHRFRPGQERSFCEAQAHAVFDGVRLFGRPHFYGPPSRGTTAAAAAVTAQVGTFNIAGNTRNHGSTEIADDVVRSMLDRRPMVMMLQESCYAQFHHTRARLASLYSGAFFKVPDRKCDGGAGSFGNVLLWRRDALAVNHTKQYHLNSAPGLEKRQMGCAKSDRPPLVACTLHLSQHDQKSSKDREMAVVAKTARGWATKYPVIVGGDFNSTPDEPQLDSMYLPDYGRGASGIFREIDNLGSRTGEPTHEEGKYDYIFFTRNLRWHWGDATFSRKDRSDHKPLWGALTM
jgi:endonuclease/exonuclease/phosphatase family metal-dependent hydrolase